MNRAGTRFAAALAAAALAAALLSACGGSDSSTESSSSSSGSASQKGSGSSGQDGSGASRAGGKETGDSNGESAPFGTSGSGAGVSTPLRVSGGGSTQFRSKGGDNSIQDFGEEGDESELEHAAEALHGFLVSRAEEDWASACAYLDQTVHQQLEQLTARSPRVKGKGCAASLAALTAPLPQAARRESTVVDAGSLRHEGEQAFLIYYGTGKKVYAIPMKPEDGVWKVAALAPVPLG